MLRVGHVIESIATLAAGPAYSVPETCNALARLGHEVELHVLDLGGTTHRPQAHYRLFAHPTDAFTVLSSSSSMRRALREAGERLDILHWHGLWRMPAIYPYWGTRGTRCRLIVSPKGMLEPAALAHARMAKRIAWSLLQEKAVRSADCLHVTSEQEARSVRNLGLTQPLALVGYGIHLPEDSDLEQMKSAFTEGRRRLLFLGRLHPIKGIDRLIRAWRQVQDRFTEWDLDIVGPDEANHLHYLRTLSAEIGARLSFLPAVHGADRDAMFASADVFVLPSHSENFGMSIPEALSFAVPVICSQGTPWSQIEREDCGYWVENSVESLAACLGAVLKKPREETAAMGRRGRAWMRREFTWEQKAIQMAAVYEWVLGRADRPDTVILD